MSTEDGITEVRQWHPEAAWNMQCTKLPEAMAIVDKRKRLSREFAKRKTVLSAECTDKNIALSHIWVKKFKQAVAEGVEQVEQLKSELGQAEVSPLFRFAVVLETVGIESAIGDYSGPIMDNPRCYQIYSRSYNLLTVLKKYLEIADYGTSWLIWPDKEPSFGEKRRTGDYYDDIRTSGNDLAILLNMQEHCLTTTTDWKDISYAAGLLRAVNPKTEIPLIPLAEEYRELNRARKRLKDPNDRDFEYGRH